MSADGKLIFDYVTYSKSGNNVDFKAECANSLTTPVIKLTVCKIQPLAESQSVTIFENDMTLDVSKFFSGVTGTCPLLACVIESS